MTDMKHFIAKLSHDKETVYLRVTSDTIEGAKHIICEAEKCPPSAVEVYEFNGKTPYTGKDLFEYARFTVDKGIEVQTEQLERWKQLLKKSVFTGLFNWATRANKDAVTGHDVLRGNDLDNFIGNYFNNKNIL